MEASAARPSVSVHQQPQLPPSALNDVNVRTFNHLKAKIEQINFSTDVYGQPIDQAITDIRRLSDTITVVQFETLVELITKKEDQYSTSGEDINKLKDAVAKLIEAPVVVDPETGYMNAATIRAQINGAAAAEGGSHGAVAAPVHPVSRPHYMNAGAVRDQMNEAAEGGSHGAGAPPVHAKPKAEPGLASFNESMKKRKSAAAVSGSQRGANTLPSKSGASVSGPIRGGTNTLSSKIGASASGPLPGHRRKSSVGGPNGDPRAATLSTQGSAAASETSARHRRQRNEGRFAAAEGGSHVAGAPPVPSASGPLPGHRRKSSVGGPNGDPRAATLPSKRRAAAAKNPYGSLVPHKDSSADKKSRGFAGFLSSFRSKTGAKPTAKAAKAAAKEAQAAQAKQEMIEKIQETYTAYATFSGTMLFNLEPFNRYEFSQQSKSPTLTFEDDDHTVKISYSNDAEPKLTVKITHNNGDGLDVDGRDVRTFTEAPSDNRTLTNALRLLGDEKILDAYRCL